MKVTYDIPQVGDDLLICETLITPQKLKRILDEVCGYEGQPEEMIVTVIEILTLGQEVN